MNEKRYSVWTPETAAKGVGPVHKAWGSARYEYESLMRDDEGIDWRIWDHTTTPPTDVTNANPEAAAPLYATIPPNVRTVEITRSLYDPDRFHVSLSGEGWSASFNTKSGHMFTDMAEITERLTRPLKDTTT